MENKKTIEYLNGRVWYRLLKVVFLFFTMGGIVVFNGIIISDGIKWLDNNKTLITCTYGEKETLTPKQIEIDLSDYDFDGEFNYKNFFEGSDENVIKAIFKNCYKQANDDIDIFTAQKVYEVYGNDRLMVKKDERPSLTETEKKYLDEIIPKIEASSVNDKVKYLDYSIKLFDIKPVYTYTESIKIFLAGNLIIVLVFEVLRRIFYYIVFGTVRPRK